MLCCLVCSLGGGPQLGCAMTRDRDNRDDQLVKQAPYQQLLTESETIRGLDLEALRRYRGKQVSSAPAMLPVNTAVFRHAIRDPFGVRRWARVPRMIFEELPYRINRIHWHSMASVVVAQ